jgi:hypothetical protein
MLKTIATVSAGTLVLTLLALPAAAAAPQGARNGVAAPSQAEQVDYRRCWNNGYRRVCRYYRGGYDNGFYGYQPYGYYGGPGLGLFFGGGGGGYRGHGGGRGFHGGGHGGGHHR